MAVTSGNVGHISQLEQQTHFDRNRALKLNTPLNNLAHKSSLLENGLRLQKAPWYIFKVLKYSSVN